MKVDISSIVRDHLHTLRDARSGQTSKFDLIIFFGLPLMGGLIANALSLKLSHEVYNVSVTFFGIFIALLLNIQVAIFGIFQRKWDPPIDEKLAAIQRQTFQARTALLVELNANISYLILFCCLALVGFLVFFAQDWTYGFAPATAVAVYTHFLLTLLMVIKRCHALFQREYRETA